MNGIVIQVHGTSGAGKTTLMRRVIEELGAPGGVEELSYSWVPKGETRYRSKDYLLGTWYRTIPTTWNNALVVGRYDGSVCGGVDTLSAPGIAEPVFAAIGKLARQYQHNRILMEGLMQLSIPRTLALHQDGVPVVAIFLTTPLAECLRRVEQRRKARGDERPLNPENTIKKHAEKPKLARRLREAGVEVYELNADAAFEQIMTVIRL